MSDIKNKIEGEIKKDNSMENQIVSMLKGVIEDSELEDFHENLNDIQGNLFGDDDFSVDFDDAETNHNTTISQNTFFRTQNEKSLTTKMDNNFIFRNLNNDFLRRRRFPTQNYILNYNFFHPINININDSFSYQIPQNCFSFNINKNNINNYYEHPFNLNPLFSHNNNSINNIPLTTTPLGKKMPIRTFNFKTKQNNKNVNLSFSNKNNYNLNNKNIKSSFFHQAFKNNNKDKINPNNFLINENTPRELEGILIQQGFSYNVFNILKGKFIPLMKTQQTSRILQFYLDQTNEEIIHLIFMEFANELEELILDIYANYFCLKIFYFLNKEDRMLFLYNISHNFDNLCINKISTYPIQCIIENLKSEEEFDLIFNSIKNKLMKLSFDIYGTHVLEKIITTFNYEKHIIHISKFIIENFILLVNNSNGLCIVKKEIILEYKKKSNFFIQLKKLLLENSLILIQNPFGNYALQIAIDNWDLEDVKDIIKSFKGKGLLLSIQKFSSNVIERCIEKDEEFLIDFINEITIDNKSIGILMKNNYGNYVIQTALKASRNNQQIQMVLINVLNKNLSILSDKKLVKKWKNIILMNTGK